MALLHGKMKSDEKRPDNAGFQRAKNGYSGFDNGIEVGVNVPMRPL